MLGVRTRNFTILLGLSLLAATVPVKAQQLGIDDATHRSLCETSAGRQELLSPYEAAGIVKGYQYQAAALKIDKVRYAQEQIDLACDIKLGEVAPFAKITPRTLSKEEREQFDAYYENYAVRYNIGAHWRNWRQEFECKSKWDNSCDTRLDFVAPKGFQACKIEYRTVTSRGAGDASKRVRISRFGEYVPEDGRAPLFQGFTIRLHSHGSGEFLDRYGGNIAIRNVRMFVLRSSVSDEVRFNYGCEIPPRLTTNAVEPQVPAPAPEPEVSAQPTVVWTSMGEKVRVVVSNPSSKTIKIGYEVYFRKAGDGKWRTKQTNASISIMPNRNYTFEVHHYGTTSWNFKHWFLRRMKAEKPSRDSNVAVICPKIR